MEFLTDFFGTMGGNLKLGFSHALTLQNLGYCLLGVILGTAIGVLPGLGPIATIALLLPITFKLDPISALIMLSGIYYGAQYGGSTTAILINLPGETSSVVTALDGHQMAKKGKAGLALFTSAIGSFFAGTIATFLIVGFAPLLASAALKFSPADYFSLMVMGFVAAVVLAQGSLLKALAMIVLGLLIAMVGPSESGAPRFTFENSEFFDGFDFVALSMGIFGIGEIIRNLEDDTKRDVVYASKINYYYYILAPLFIGGAVYAEYYDIGPSINVFGFRPNLLAMVSAMPGLALLYLLTKNLLPTWAEFKEMIPPILRGTTVGSALGILPGGGAILGAFAAYSLEKRLSKTPQEFGKGKLAGVAAPESANNAGAQVSFIPMLTLGIPSNPVMALMLGALIIHRIVPGPTLVTDRPELFWGVVSSMWIGNFMLLVLNLPLIGMWVKFLTIPYRLLFPGIVTICCIGVYSVSNNPFDVHTMAACGVIGYVLFKLECEPAPLLLGFVIGRLMEQYFVRAMQLSFGDATVFVREPISAGLLFVSVVALVLVLLPAIRKKREEAFQE
jgi:putative tricarboxylic transport membrane protein